MECLSQCRRFYLGTGEIGTEIQLTDAIEKLIQWGHKVHAIKLRPDDLRLDIGTPEIYWEAERLSYHYFSGRKV